MSDLISVDKQNIIYFKNLPEIQFKCLDDDELAGYLIIFSMIEVCEGKQIGKIISKSLMKDAPDKSKGIEFLMYCFLNILIENE